MSGLCGVVDFAAPRIDPESLRSMAESSSYRAPGGINYLFLNEAGLAYQALQAPAAGAVLDQPLLDPRHQVCIVMDGRLDNRSELIDRLDPAGGRSTSDAGLLLVAYLEWGVGCTEHLLGDFAFAVWDAPRRRLFCAVDALGIKPLHYAKVGSLICFASDAVQVLFHPAVPDGYNELEIAAYLECQWEHPKRSFFEAIEKLAPGHRLIAESGVLRVECYWIPKLGEIRYARDEDYAAHFLEIFQRSVSDRLRDSGSFAGVAMSGGLDSTSVAALAYRRNPSTRAYTFVFDQLAECDERSYSATMTEELGLEVEPVEAERLWSLESQRAIPLSPDTPFFGWRACHGEIFRRMAAGNGRVILTGHGGDDLLRGSLLVYAERLRSGDLGAVREVVRHYRGREPILRSMYRHFGRPHLPASVDRLLTRTIVGNQQSVSSLLHPDFARRTQLVGRMSPLATRFFPSPALREIYGHLVGIPWYQRLANWHDRNSASCGIEVRHPFLDRRLFEYVFAIPGEQLFRLDTYKNLLRRSMAGILPERIRLREGKTRFTRFLDFLLLERAAGEIKDLLQMPRSADAGILNGEKLRFAYQNLSIGGPDVPRRDVWYAIAVEIWLRRCDAIRQSRRQGAQGGQAAA